MILKTFKKTFENLCMLKRYSKRATLGTPELLLFSSHVSSFSTSYFLVLYIFMGPREPSGLIWCPYPCLLLMCIGCVFCLDCWKVQVCCTFILLSWCGLAATQPAPYRWPALFWASSIQHKMEMILILKIEKKQRPPCHPPFYLLTAYPPIQLEPLHCKTRET